MNSIDWTLVRSFLAVVEAGSLSAAAGRIGTTHPTLSRHIRELETVLGVTLFTRSMRGVDPTDAALAFIDDARAMGEAAEAFALKAQGRSEKLAGTVRITASVVVSNLLLPRIIADLRVAEPNIQIEIVPSDTAHNLLRRDADIAIRMFEPTQNALIARKLGDTPIGLFATKAYFDRRGRINSVSEVLKHDVIGFDRNDDFLKFFAAHVSTTTRESFPIRCDDQMVHWHLLLAGAGIGFAQMLLARLYPEIEQVDLDLGITMPIWLVLHEEVRANARIRRVSDFVSAALSEVLREE